MVNYILKDLETNLKEYNLKLKNKNVYQNSMFNTKSHLEKDKKN